MNTKELNEMLSIRVRQIEHWLETCLDTPTMPERLREAMKYSLLAGGKRLRPVLCISTAEMCGLSADTILPFAGALEYIHTYSLIHDDLPAMDDDDLRRGQPSCHKAFDEATAILAGDGLLTDAFLVMASLKKISADRLLAALAEVAQAAGSSGMVGGQVMDIECTGKNEISPATLKSLDALKTGAMFRASCATGGILAGASEQALNALRAYGEALGAAFQIVDDILDATSDTETIGKPAGSDSDMGKTTFPTLFGLERSRELAKEAADRAVKHLEIFEDSSKSRKICDFLQTLAIVLIDRIH